MDQDRTLLLIAGYLYILALPYKRLGRGTYISENAIQPAQVRKVEREEGGHAVGTDIGVGITGEYVLGLGGGVRCR